MKGEGKIYQHPKSRFLWMQYFHQGKRSRESTEETDGKKAAKKLKDKLAEIRLDKTGKVDFVPTSQLRVRDLLDALEADYRLREVKSLPQIKAHLKPVREILGGCRAQGLTPEVVDKYIEARLRVILRPRLEPRPKGQSTAKLPSSGESSGLLSSERS